MLISHTSKMSAGVLDVQIKTILESVLESDLRQWVKTVSIPRHYQFQPKNNQWIAQWIRKQLQSYGYQTQFQGKYNNVMTLPPNHWQTPSVLIGAHYDSVPETRGADDNGSAIAALLGCAKAIAKYAPQTPVCFVSFNCEEDGLLGSQDLVNNYLLKYKIQIAHAHILEMVGYCKHSSNSQQIPSGLETGQKFIDKHTYLCKISPPKIN
jgi:Zn-dependent M28 family amino/carboxypeptidase